MIKIEKGVPIPDKKGKNHKYPWSEMDVGDSFIVGGVALHVVYAAVSSRNRRNPETMFTVRSTDVGPRVWRVK